MRMISEALFPTTSSADLDVQFEAARATLRTERGPTPRLGAVSVWAFRPLQSSQNTQINKIGFRLVISHFFPPTRRARYVIHVTKKLRGSWIQND